MKTVLPIYSLHCVCLLTCLLAPLEPANKVERWEKKGESRRVGLLLSPKRRATRALPVLRKMKFEDVGLMS